MTPRSHSPSLLPALLLAAGLALAAATAEAQVIEIGEGGSIVTYDRPATFDADGGHPFSAPPTPRAPALAGHHAAAAATLAPAFDREGAAAALSPALLSAVAFQESRYRIAAVSPKGALGVMQLMPGTAAALGVDARDPDGNVRGGARYLRAMLDYFGGDLPRALAAYNAGPGAVARYGGVPPFAETQAYVAGVMASLARFASAPADAAPTFAR